MAETTLSKKMRAFDDEVALTVAPFYLIHMLQRTLPAGFIAPCLPTKTDKLPSGSQWLHEIKHDGFRIIARKNRAQVGLYSRPGNDLTHRFPLIVETLARLRPSQRREARHASAQQPNGCLGAPPAVQRIRQSVGSKICKVAPSLNLILAPGDPLSGRRTNTPLPFRNRPGLRRQHAPRGNQREGSSRSHFRT